jgi:hypothetical protein
MNIVQELEWRFYHIFVQDMDDTQHGYRQFETLGGIMTDLFWVVESEIRDDML